MELNLNLLDEYDKGKIPKNKEIFESFLVTNKKMQDYNNVLVSISGGSDSDVLLDLTYRLSRNNVRYLFLDTGLEFKATKEHLKYLQEVYGIEIEVVRGKKPIPIACRDYGQPFLSKQVSEYISRLQEHDFKWQDKSFEELHKEYPQCKAALKWWCNLWGEGSRFNISYNKGLKEFMIQNPPTFKISNKCCKYAKKDPVKNFIKENKFDLNCYGVRKAEGGVRSTSYKNCFTDNSEKGKIDEYRPLFWYKDETKRVYEEHFDIKHSRCYTEYGMKRTGCAGCPYGQDMEEELRIIEKYEPNLYKAVWHIFGDSYEYTRKYREFVKKKNLIDSNKIKQLEGQIEMNFEINQCK